MEYCVSENFYYDGTQLEVYITVGQPCSGQEQ